MQGCCQHIIRGHPRGLAALRKTRVYVHELLVHPQAEETMPARTNNHTNRTDTRRTQTHTHPQTHTRTHTHNYTNTLMRSPSNTHAHTHTRTQTHTQTHTHTHTHKHAKINMHTENAPEDVHENYTEASREHERLPVERHGANNVPQLLRVVHYVHEVVRKEEGAHLRKTDRGARTRACA